MPTILTTIKSWANGYNSLLGLPEPVRRELAPALSNAVSHLRCHSSLADLAAAYCDGDYLERIAEEFHPDASIAPAIRDGAYWLRFMEIRHSCVIA